MCGSSALAVKPPPAFASFAMKDAPATTEGSSSTIGTNTSLPFTTEVAAMSQWQGVNPTTFSIM
jgi:hypothetical protein